jgi:hypothetical protein
MHAMNSSMTQGLVDLLQGRPMQLISRDLGLSPQQAAGAVTAALPLLLGALARNSRRPAGDRNLFDALQKDHMGQDPQSVLASAVAGGQRGDRILRHVFGAREPVASQALATAAGVAPDHAQRLLRWLAPVAMAYLAKQVFERRARPQATSAQVTAPTPQELKDKLDREQAQLRNQGGLAGRLLSTVLDRNHDGRVDFSDLYGGAANSPRPSPPAGWDARDSA